MWDIFIDWAVRYEEKTKSTSRTITASTCHYKPKILKLRLLILYRHVLLASSLEYLRDAIVRYRQPRGVLNVIVFLFFLMLQSPIVHIFYYSLFRFFLFPNFVYGIVLILVYLINFLVLISYIVIFTACLNVLPSPQGKITKKTTR